MAYQLYLSIITAILQLNLIFENCCQCTLHSSFCHLISSNIALTVLVNRFTANCHKHFHASSGPTVFSFFIYCFAVQTFFSVICFTVWNMFSTYSSLFFHFFVQEFNKVFSPSFENIFLLCWHLLSPKPVAHFFSWIPLHSRNERASKTTCNHW